MSLNIISPAEPDQGVFDVIETALESSGWQFERDGQEAVHCIAPSRWGEMGGLFACRRTPSAVHFSLTVDAKPQAARRAVISELIMMMNERLWLGHFDFWADDNVIIFRHALPLADRMYPTSGEISATLAAGLEAVDRFVPAFNFVVWAGKTPAEAIEAVMFETDGEA